VGDSKRGDERDKRDGRKGRTGRYRPNGQTRSARRSRADRADGAVKSEDVTMTGAELTYLLAGVGAGLVIGMLGLGWMLSR